MEIQLTFNTTGVSAIVLSSAPVQQEQHQYLSGPVTVPIQPSNIQNKGPGEHQTGTINYHLSFGNNNDSEQ
ncbi:unnamed protein product [Rotaria sp. Silwood2]|nr:unnamed protein product [Rotaria sp. Silwood2]